LPAYPTNPNNEPEPDDEPERELTPFERWEQENKRRSEAMTDSMRSSGRWRLRTAILSYANGRIVSRSRT